MSSMMPARHLHEGKTDISKKCVVEALRGGSAGLFLVQHTK